jgi:hypothetical protein
MPKLDVNRVAPAGWRPYYQDLGAWPRQSGRFQGGGLPASLPFRWLKADNFWLIISTNRLRVALSGCHNRLAKTLFDFHNFADPPLV